MLSAISTPIAELEAFCQRHHIRKLSLFGSVLREDFAPDSDIDVLVEFEEGTRIGLIRFSQIELELSALIGRKVDLNTPQDLSDFFRDTVLASAQVLYE